MNIRHTLLAGSVVLALASLTACGSTPPVAKAQPVAAVQQTASAQAASAAYDFDMDVFHPVVARNGMVATEQELASQIGLDILKAGGNAVDAAVGIGFALAVALPNAGNLGGGGFMMVHDAKTGKSVALDFREVAPSRPRATCTSMPKAMWWMASRSTPTTPWACPAPWPAWSTRSRAGALCPFRV